MLKSIKGASLALAVVALSATAAIAGTVNAVTNGNFETNTLIGWTMLCPTSGSTVTGETGARDRFIDSGSIYAFVNSQSQTSVTCDLYQDIAIPAAATGASLTMRYALTGSNPQRTGLERRRIDVTSQADTVLVNIQPEVDRNVTRAFAPLVAPVDLVAYAGQTVRIRARVTNTPLSNSANLIALDDVVLNVTTPDPAAIPTLTEWTRILFGFLLAGGAALYIQRRRTA